MITAIWKASVTALLIALIAGLVVHHIHTIQAIQNNGCSVVLEKIQ